MTWFGENFDIPRVRVESAFTRTVEWVCPLMTVKEYISLHFIMIWQTRPRHTVGCRFGCRWKQPLRTPPSISLRFLDSLDYFICELGREWYGDFECWYMCEDGSVRQVNHQELLARGIYVADNAKDIIPDLLELPDEGCFLWDHVWVFPHTEEIYPDPQESDYRQRDLDLSIGEPWPSRIFWAPKYGGFDEHYQRVRQATGRDHRSDYTTLPRIWEQTDSVPDRTSVMAHIYVSGNREDGWLIEQDDEAVARDRAGER